jgi:hypothetical protein
MRCNTHPAFSDIDYSTLALLSPAADIILADLLLRRPPSGRGHSGNVESSDTVLGRIPS